LKKTLGTGLTALIVSGLVIASPSLALADTITPETQNTATTENVATQAIPVTAPTGVNGSVSSARKNITANINWDAVEGATSYTVTLTSSGNETRNTTVTNTTATVQLPDTAKVTWSAVVVASNGTESASSTSVQLSGTVEGFQPDPPTNFQVVQTDASGTSITTTWDNPVYTGGGSLTQALMYVYDYTSGEYIVNKNDFPGGTTSYTFPATPNHRYYLAVYVASSASIYASAGTPTNYDNIVAAAPDAPSISGYSTGQYDKNSEVYYLNAQWHAGATHNSPITGYRIEVKNDAGYSTTYYAGADDTSARIPLDNVDFSAHYSFTVTAASVAGDSPASTEYTTFTVAPGRTAPVQNLIAKTTGLTTARLLWEAPNQKDGNEVRRYAINVYDTNGRVVQSFDFPGTDTALNVSGLEAGSNYRFEVSTVSNSGAISRSVSANVTTDSSAPDAAQSVQAVVSKENADRRYSVNVSWKSGNANGSTVTGYTVLLLGDNGYRDSVVVGPDTLETNFLLDSNHSTTFHTEVTTNSNLGDSPVAKSNDFVQPVGTPSPVHHVGTSVNGSDSIIVEWGTPQDNGGSNALKYNVVAEDESGVVDSQTTEHNYARFQNLKPGQKYTFTVTAIGLTNLASTPVTVTESTRSTASSAPGNLQLDAEGSNLKATWEAPQFDGGSAITGYVVTALDSNGTLKTQEVTSTDYTFADFLKPGHNYTVSVTAVNASGNSEAATAEYKQNANVPNAPTNVKTAVTAEGITVTWDAPKDNGGANITGYTVIIAQQGWADTRDVDADTFTATFSNITFGKTYTIYVVAHTEAGDSVLTDGDVVRTIPGAAPKAPTADEIIESNGTADLTIDAVKKTATVYYANAEEGDWVYGYVYSQPYGLGWKQLNANKEASWDLTPAQLATGTHTFVVVDLSDTVVGTAEFEVPGDGAVVPGDNGSNPGDNGNGNIPPVTSTPTQPVFQTPAPGNTVLNGAVGNTGSDSVKKNQGDLAYTGSEGLENAAVIAGGIMLLGFGVLMVNRRRRKA
jgi:hypothetical protein